MSTISSKRITEFNDLAAGSINGNEYTVIAKDNNNFKLSLNSIYQWIKNKLKLDRDVLDEYIKQIYPIGSIYISVNSSQPFPTISSMVWKKVSTSRCLQGSDNSHNPGTTIDSGLPSINGSISINTSSLNHTHTINDPGHSHSYILTHGNAGADPDSSSNGKYQKNSDTSSSKTGITISGASFNQQTITANLTSSNSIYGNSTTVQPPVYIVNIWQRTK